MNEFSIPQTLKTATAAPSTRELSRPASEFLSFNFPNQLLLINLRLIKIRPAKKIIAKSPSLKNTTTQSIPGLEGTTCRSLTLCDNASIQSKTLPTEATRRGSNGNDDQP